MAAIAVVGGVLSAGVAGAGAPAKQTGPNTPKPKPLKEKTDVTISAALKIEGLAPVFLAQKMGEFEKENLNVTLVAPQPNNEGLVLLSQGEVDMQASGLAAANFNGIAQGSADTRYVADVARSPQEDKSGIYVRKELFKPDGTIDKEKVKGIRVALGSSGLGAPSTISLYTWLQTLKLELSDVEGIALGQLDGVAGIQSGAVSAANITSPFYQQPAIAECCKLVSVTPAPPVSRYVFAADALKDKKQRTVAKAIMRAIMRTVRTYLQGKYHNDAKVMAALSDALGTPVATLTAGTTFIFDPNMGISAEVDVLAQKVWLAAGSNVLSYTKALPAKKFDDTSIIKELLAE